MARFSTLQQTRVQTVGDVQLARTVSWYDNEMSYVSQLVRTRTLFCKLISKDIKAKAAVSDYKRPASK